MKICSLYGVGFYYIPGTDMCVKIGGWVRAEYAYGDNGNITWGWANGNTNDRRTSNSTWRVRGYITADARNQTEYGTVRSYIAIGTNGNDTTGPDAAFTANRAFIQWAGFTFGRAQSFYDFYSTPATSYWGGFPGSDTGDPGWDVAAYTAQFGNGLSATISAEVRRNTFIYNAGAVTTNQYGGYNAPDIVGNLRVDQAWGSAQIMGALHQVNATYYGATATSAIPGAGHPSDKWGFAVGAGIKLNAPVISQGDYLQAQVTYTQGALGYVFATPKSNWSSVEGSKIGFGVLSDAIYGGTVAGGTATDLELTTAWNVNAAYEHFWNARWKTSLYGGYAAVSYGSRANNLICTGSAALSINGCDMNWSTWWLGSRTQWNVSKDFYLGLDVMYAKLQSASVPTGTVPSIAPTYVSSVGDMDNWQFRFRAHKDFYP